MHSLILIHNVYIASFPFETYMYAWPHSHTQSTHVVGWCLYDVSIAVSKSIITLFSMQSTMVQQGNFHVCYVVKLSHR